MGNRNWHLACLDARHSQTVTLEEHSDHANGRNMSVSFSIRAAVDTLHRGKQYQNIRKDVASLMLEIVQAKLLLVPHSALLKPDGRESFGKLFDLVFQLL